MEALYITVMSLCLWVIVEMMFPTLWDNSIQPALLVAAGLGALLHLALFARRGRFVGGLLSLVLIVGFFVGMMYLALAYFLNLQNDPNLFGNMFHTGQ